MALENHHNVLNVNVLLAAAGFQKGFNTAITPTGYNDGLYVGISFLTSTAGVNAFGNLADKADTNPAYRDYGFFLEGLQGGPEDRAGVRWGSSNPDDWPYTPSVSPPSNVYPGHLIEVNPDANSWLRVVACRLDVTDGEFPGSWPGPGVGNNFDHWYRSGLNAVSGHDLEWFLTDFPQTTRAAERIKATLVEAFWNSGSSRYELRDHTFTDDTDQCAVGLWVDTSAGTAITLLAQDYPNGTGPTTTTAYQNAIGVAHCGARNGTTGISAIRAEYGTSMDVNVATTGGSGQMAYFSIIEISRDVVINPLFAVASAARGGPNRRSFGQMQRRRARMAQIQRANSRMRAASFGEGKELEEFPALVDVNWTDYLT